MKIVEPIMGVAPVGPRRSSPKTVTVVFERGLSRSQSATSNPRTQ